MSGRYVTAEDVGMNARDMEFIGMETSHATGGPELTGGSGDPSPVTAYGVYMGIKAAAKKTYGFRRFERQGNLCSGSWSCWKSISKTFGKGKLPC